MFPAKLLFCHLLLQTPVYDALREAAGAEQVTEQVEKFISVMGDKVYKSKALMELLEKSIMFDANILMVGIENRNSDPNCSFDNMKESDMIFYLAKLNLNQANRNRNGEFYHTKLFKIYH